MSEGFEQVGQRIRFLIENRGVSHGQLARAIGVDAPRLSKWLSGRDSFTAEYLDVIVQYLGESERELSYLRSLHDLHKWQHRLEQMAALELSRFGTASEHLAPHLIRLAKELAEAERAVDPAIRVERLQLKHLLTLNIVASSIVTAMQKTESPIFNEDNIAAHLRFPANYYVAAFLNLNDANFEGGAELGDMVQRLVDGVVEGQPGWSFMARIMRQHAHHVNARYSKAGAQRDELNALKHSKDVNDRRMYLIGLALRSDAPESAWANLFDELEKAEFQSAVLAFDTCHYGDNEMEKDGIRPRPTHIRRTALRYFAGLLAPDPNQQLFAAKRLLTLLDHATPAMVREADLGGEARKVADATGAGRPEEANRSLNLIKRIDDEE